MSAASGLNTGGHTNFMSKNKTTEYKHPMPFGEGDFSTDSEDIVDHLMAALQSDGDWKKKHEDTVVHRYRHSSAETRDMVNQIFASLSGWSFATLAKRAGYHVRPYEPPSEQVRDWEIQTWE